MSSSALYKEPKSLHVQTLRVGYLTCNAARQDVFDYIEMFYNPTRKHTNNGMLSPVDYEMKQKKMNAAGV